MSTYRLQERLLIARAKVIAARARKDSRREAEWSDITRAIEDEIERQDQS